MRGKGTFFVPGVGVGGHSRYSPVDRRLFTRTFRTPEFLALNRIQGGALVYWRKESIDDWGAPILGAACKALLESERCKLLILDFSNVRELSTQALATLIRFQNAVDCLKQRLVLVAGDELCDLLEKSRVAGPFEIRSEIHSLILPEMTFETRPAVKW